MSISHSLSQPRYITKLKWRVRLLRVLWLFQSSYIVYFSSFVSWVRTSHIVSLSLTLTLPHLSQVPQISIPFQQFHWAILLTQFLIKIQHIGPTSLAVFLWFCKINSGPVWKSLRVGKLIVNQFSVCPDLIHSELKTELVLDRLSHSEILKNKYVPGSQSSM